MRYTRFSRLSNLLLILLTAAAFSPARSQDLKSFEQRITTKVLPNGLTIVICERHDAPVFSYNTFVDAGDVNDPSGDSGLAHMFEHLAFKGTTQIGTTDYAAEKVALQKVEEANDAYEAEFRKIIENDWGKAQALAAAKSEYASMIQAAGDNKSATEAANNAYDSKLTKIIGHDPTEYRKLETNLDQAQAAAEKYVIPNQFTEVAEQNGAHDLNAETGLDETEYFWSMPENRFELWAWMESSRLADIVPREFYKERDVVMEERRMRVDSNPIGRLEEQFLATAYVAHNYGRSSIGWPSEVGQITATEAMAFHRKYYVAGNIVVAIVGDINPKTAMPLLEKYFGRVPAGPKPEDMTTVEPKQFAEKTLLIREQTQPIYIEGYHRPSYHDPDDAVYDAISDILSNGRVSRLYRSLVEQQQIAAEAVGESPFPGEKYPSLFFFGAVPLPGHTPDEMREAIHKEIDKLKTTDVTDAELQMYKTRTRADLLRGLADNQGLANSLAEYQTRYGDWRELFLQLDRVDKVTKADIRRVANKVFVASNRTTAEIDTNPPAAAPAKNGGAQ